MKELVRAYPTGTVLFEENDPGSRMYVVKRGRVRIWRRLGDTEVVLAVIQTGDFFGEMAILEGLPRSASATVVEDAELIEIDQDAFDQMLRANAEISLRMMRKLSERLRQVDRRLQNALVENGLGRMIEALRWLREKGEPEAGGWVRVGPMPIDLFARAGISVEQRAEVEARLSRAKVFRVHDGDALVADNEVLEAFSEYLHLHQIYDPLITRELADGGEVQKEVLERLVRRVLVAKMATIDGVVADPASDRVIAQYERYVSLKERFG